MTEKIKCPNCETYLEERGVRVFGWFDCDGAVRFSELRVIGSDKGEATHQALLISIEERTKKECEHLPTYYNMQSNECRHCGIKIKPTWNPA